MKTSIFPK
jgi:hypothetical protein